MTSQRASTPDVARLHSSPESMDLAKLNSMSQLLLAVNAKLKSITMPLTFEQLQKNENVLSLGVLLSRQVNTRVLKPIVEQLRHNDYPGVIWTLIWTAFEFSQAAQGEDRHIDSTRSLAAELIAIRVLRFMSYQDIIRALTLDFELPSSSDDGAGEESTDEQVGETPTDYFSEHRTFLEGMVIQENELETGVMESRINSSASSAMSALEVAIVADALKFIGSPIVQDVLQDIWKGNIVLWGDLDVNASTARKKPSVYTWRRTAWVGYARLRVPRYRFAFQVANFAILLLLFLATLMQADREYISVQEIFLDIWFLGFAYAELGQIRDSTLTLYIQDPWSFFDVAMLLIFVGWIVARALGLSKENWATTDFAFDVLSLQALFLVPRAFSFLGLWQYYGQLLPTLKELVKDFFKFLVIIAILYCGFFVTFWSLGRDTYTVSQMGWLLVRIFFGSSYIGFDSMYKFGVFGPALMITFICLTQVVLITVLISILSNQFAKYNARDQYHFLFAYSCVESISSNHAFDFYPPTNLLQLLLLRPIRLFLPSRHPILQNLKFTLLRITHAPFVLFVTAFEQAFYSKQNPREALAGSFRPPSSSSRSAKVAAKRASFYGHIQSKEPYQPGHEDVRGAVDSEIRDMNVRLRQLEGEIASMKDMIRFLVTREMGSES